ncbi:hypothetical protein J4Q44_G00107740 [Coregonus suidteri]|uniref:Uncharacterized protein n=1 Tax=Coregonus suidteri TaxID=861788 RepID=A0AAN8R1P5_9TELE
MIEEPSCEEGQMQHSTDIGDTGQLFESDSGEEESSYRHIGVVCEVRLGWTDWVPLRQASELWSQLCGSAHTATLAQLSSCSAHLSVTCWPYRAPPALIRLAAPPHPPG